MAKRANPDRAHRDNVSYRLWTLHTIHIWANGADLAR
jgi:hypothetical protein